MTTGPIPPESLDDLMMAAATRRAELARSFLRESAVQALLRIDYQTLTAWRKGKRLLAVWHEPFKAWLYPDFQFDQEGLIKEMPEMLAVYDRYYSHVWGNTWTILEWFLSPHALLDGRRPMEVLASDPQQVLTVARDEFWEDPAAYW